jgi:hypothetical protein
MTKKMGRPEIQIDFTTVDKLCQIQCTQEEIASVLNVSVDTLERRCKEINSITFAEYSAQKRQGGKMSLRRKQMEVAMAGDKTLLVWLGKQYLGQADKQEIGGPDGGDLKLQVEIVDSKHDNKKPVAD